MTNYLCVQDICVNTVCLLRARDSQGQFYGYFLHFRYCLNLFLLNKIQLTTKEIWEDTFFIQIPWGQKWYRLGTGTADVVFLDESHICCSYQQANKQFIHHNGGIWGRLIFFFLSCYFAFFADSSFFTSSSFSVCIWLLS